MRMKACVCKTFAFVFSKEPAVTQNYVIDFVAGTFSIQTMPFFGRLLTLPMSQMKQIISLMFFFDFHYMDAVWEKVWLCRPVTS